MQENRGGGGRRQRLVRNEFSKTRILSSLSTRHAISISMQLSSLDEPFATMTRSLCQAFQMQQLASAIFQIYSDSSGS